MPKVRPNTVTLDVRPLLSRGEEPFSRIMAALAGLSPGDTLILVTPFIPSPLIEKLQSEGFAVRPERGSDGTWQTQFRKPQS